MSDFEYPALSASIVVPDAARAIEFYKAAFRAKERCRLLNPASGKIGHAEILIDDALLMLTENSSAHIPEATGRITVQLALRCADVDAVFHRATASGAREIRPPANHFHGHRCASIRDPFGYEWMLFQEIESLSPEEMQRRWNAMPPAGDAPAQ